MGIKDIWYTEKGRMGIIISSTILITSVIVVPISILITKSFYKNDKFIQTYAYDASDSSTAKRQNEWMEIDGKDTIEQEKNLLKNKNYHSINGPDNILDGVRKTKGLSYLSNIEVSSKGNIFKPLDISNSYDKEGDPIWIKPGSEDYIHAPFNLTMKVPINVSQSLREHLSIKEPKKLEIDSLDKENNYGDWLKNNNYQKDFAVSFILFNYISFSKQAGIILHENGLNPVNDQINTGVSGPDFLNWVKITFPEDIWGSIEGDEKLIVDGTGTDEKALNIVIDGFNNDETIKSLNLNITQYLNDGGSYRAWETTEENFLPPGVILNPDEYDGKNDGTPNAFLGTASRGINPHNNIEEEHNSEEISYWGYEESVYYDLYGKIEPSNIIYNIDDFTIGKDSEKLPLATTIATDSIVFFTTDSLTVLNPETNKKEFPMGITRNGLKSIFEYGETWENLAKVNELEF